MARWRIPVRSSSTFIYLFSMKWLTITSVSFDTVTLFSVSFISSMFETITVEQNCDSIVTQILFHC